MDNKRKRACHLNGKDQCFVYVTDEELMKHLKRKGYRAIETGFNESTNETYWKYEYKKGTDDIHRITIPWENEKKLEKYSLDRWQLSKSDTE